ncbi:MAG: pyruvate kinase [Candidatus Magasanikbacteria bacterium CG10_big_fil_rev_8_21_14_0_10_47_10]|uniref:Pyruvate kinase n=1 Tax=Candidatus Magasanikbacteria bacterium CG10_big_fil_rev_8_21_14_0_10_47_10 TaxID=1974652 RepID=A0A2H0TR04_9BACT|nr:MAG: pyruvate kinase [Candidatus Magasanikbacteria bacterium CG10_big_fil_rev_8_21_14_0_10_47_10]
MKKRTKIVCTLGPACETQDILEEMVTAGMNVARLNFSHGTYENHATLIKNIRAVSKKTGEAITILQDLQGPKIRIGVMPEEGFDLVEGKEIMLDTGIKEFADGVMPVDYEQLHEFLKPGERILINDGRSEIEVKKIEGTRIHGVVTVGGNITSHKGMNVPDTKLEIRALTEKDKKDAIFGIEQGVDMMALSFVMTPEDVLDLRYHIKEQEKKMALNPEQPIRIVAKIERFEAVKNIKAIIDVVDGIMVARGDLGVEIPAQEVPLTQKRLIDVALEAAKPVIVATQLLDSMRENPRPTRAEVSDVANAVIDHTDAVMLSNETAVGKYPVLTVETMANIIAETEKSHYDDLQVRNYKEKKHQIDTVISEMSRLIAERVDSKIILAASISGETGRLISRHRPELPIVVATNNERTRHQLNVSWGVHPFVLPDCRTIEELVERSVTYLKAEKIVKPGDNIIVVAGEPVGQAGHVNLIEVREVS